MAEHTIELVTEPTGHTYCATCGRNVMPFGKTPAVGTWPIGTVATVASHQSTSRAVVARRLSK